VEAYSLLIDGKLVGSSAQLDVINPATATVIARCPRGSPGSDRKWVMRD
jgi:acyl-CoA reductase-like NAD-dependent aldehyde dehydrogenase